MPPFIEGNGTTYCAACYFLLCVRSGDLLPGLKIVPERIKEDRDGYERALFAADRAWDNGHLDFSVMEDYLATLLQAQLADDGLDRSEEHTSELQSLMRISYAVFCLKKKKTYKKQKPLTTITG